MTGLRKVLLELLGMGLVLGFGLTSGAVSSVLKSPSLVFFLLTANANGMVSDVGCVFNGCWSWNLLWRRSLFSWEEDQVRDLMRLLQTVPVSVGLVDGWRWLRDKEGCFSVRSAYRSLADHDLLPVEVCSQFGIHRF
ncbi:hypothetical protein RIF29_05993 [Crotalaria pallida]|uniref:Uncharacterized protein n=1 Tax=Crotalaria pallida TaxID=3830 RepID=A0AAN9J3G1_CROPI